MRGASTKIAYIQRNSNSKQSGAPWKRKFIRPIFSLPDIICKLISLRKGPFQEQRNTIVITSINNERLSEEKEILISDICRRNMSDVLMVQETHRGPTKNTSGVSGMKLVIERPHDQYGSCSFFKNDLVIKSMWLTENNNIEILTV